MLTSPVAITCLPPGRAAKLALRQPDRGQRARIRSARTRQLTPGRQGSTRSCQSSRGTSPARNIAAPRTASDVATTDVTRCSNAASAPHSRAIRALPASFREPQGLPTAKNTIRLTNVITVTAANTAASARAFPPTTAFNTGVPPPCSNAGRANVCWPARVRNCPGIAARRPLRHIVSSHERDSASRYLSSCTRPVCTCTARRPTRNGRHAWRRLRVELRTRPVDELRLLHRHSRRGDLGR